MQYAALIIYSVLHTAEHAVCSFQVLRHDKAIQLQQVCSEQPRQLGCQRSANVCSLPAFATERRAAAPMLPGASAHRSEWVSAWICTALNRQEPLMRWMQLVTREQVRFKYRRLDGSEFQAIGRASENARRP